MSDAENPHGNNEYNTAPSKIIGRIWFSDIFCLRNPRYNIGNRQVAAIKYLKKAREMGSVSKIINRVATIDMPALIDEIAAAILASIILFIFYKFGLLVGQ